MDLNSTGLGIGTSSPAAPLNVQKTGTGSVTSILLSRTTENSADQQSIVWKSNDLALDYASIAGVIETGTEGSMQLKTASGGTLATRVTISSAGNVGIGTSTFATNSKFAVQTSTCKLDITSEGGSSIKLLASSGGLTLSAPSGFFFDTSGTQQFEARDLQLYSNGTIKATTSISVGNAVPTTSGAGITFPATQSASSNANTLDDYEEGTWTPVLTGDTSSTGITYSGQVGRYIKIGNLVTVDISLTLSAKTLIVGNVIITGIPFSGHSDTNTAVTWGYWNNLAQNWISLGGWLNGGNTIYLGGRKTAGAGIDTLLNADIATNTSLNCSITFKVA
jgi:hypothetical protein